MSQHDYSETVLREFAFFEAGDLIGEGMSRKVYEYPADDSKVLKVETTVDKFQNVMEWETWQALRDTWFGKYLAPCYRISHSGTFLIMAKTEPLQRAQAPNEMPSWLSDYKLKNYGIFEGRVVCHDYGTNLLFNNGAFAIGKRLKKVKEWY